MPKRSPSSSVSGKAAARPGAPTVAEAVRRRITAVARAKPGKIFTPSDFLDLGSPQGVGMALLRLERSGELRRIGRGLYERPRVHPKFGSLLPDAEQIARALAAKGHMKLQPSGAYAANLLGLTEQVPLKLVFLTDGAPRTVRIGSQQIILRRAAPRTMATAGRVSGVVIQALRHLKRANVNESVLRKLRRRLREEDKAILQTDARFAPVWIAEVMHSLVARQG